VQASVRAGSQRAVPQTSATVARDVRGAPARCLRHEPNVIDQTPSQAWSLLLVAGAVGLTLADG
jgi:hypothetical protein